MKRTAISGIVLTLMLIVLTATFNVHRAMASGTIYIRPDGTVDPSTAPINKVGDVYTFTSDIYEPIVVEADNIVIEGNGYTLQGPGPIGYGFYLSGRSGVTIKNVTIKGWNFGIELTSSWGNSICGNDITNNWPGIELTSSSGNSISGNNITDSGYGIWLWSSSNNSIAGNNIMGIYYDVIRLFDSWGNSISGNNITDNNEWGGGSSIFLAATSSDSTAGNNTIAGNNITANHGDGISLGGSSGNNISGNNIANNDYGIRHSGGSGNIIAGNNMTANNNGIWLAYSSSNSIAANNITNSGSGIILCWSSGDSIAGNNIADNYYGIFGLIGASSDSIAENNIANNHYGIWLWSSSSNSIYHNNFIDNAEQVYSDASTNVWDDGYPSGGNYWSDYVTRYPSAQELDDSGIWDTPYVLDENNRDNYPLMEPWAPTPPTIMASLDIDPDTLSLKSEGKWITAYIQLPEGYSPEDIDASTVLLNGTIAPVLDPKYDFVINPSEYLVDNNNDGILERMVKFDRTAVESLIYSQGIRYGYVSLTLTGELLDGTPLEGTNVVFVNYAGDVNNDGKIDILDASVISAHWYPGPPTGLLGYEAKADLNNDGLINIVDSGTVSSNWGQTVPSTTL